MESYCIQAGSTQQCSDCTLINGVLRFADGYPPPNCAGTTWVRVNPAAGSNGTPVYKVVPMPFDSAYLLIVAAVLVWIFLRKKALSFR